VYYLDSMLLKGFRNYRHQQLQFNPRLNLISGENAQGKTNLLESIYYLSVNRSFRTKRDHELLKWDDPYFILKGNFYKNNFNNDVEIYYRQSTPLKITVNNKGVKRYDHLQKFPVVVFSPDDISLIREGPSIRRSFLNLEASRLSLVYFDDLRSYQRVLRQRNYLIKDLYSHNRNQIEKLLEPWDHSLVSLGSKIIHARENLIKSLEREAQIFFDRMTNYRESLSLEYDASFDYCADPEHTKKRFEIELKANREKELLKRSTVIGPHLDDLKIRIDGYDTRKYSSQGQKRTAALALKMAEVSIFKNEHNECPIILLDDVFSEFDDKRKMHLLDFLNESSGQCFITTAVDLKNLEFSFKSDYKTISVRKGRVINEASGSGH